MIMGVTDPLGGINTLFPLFGIANQLLAAIALAACLAIVSKNTKAKYLWIVILPLAFVTVVTVVASFQKIFSPVPAVGYWAQHNAFKQALADGKTKFGNAPNVEAMEAVVRNTTVQGTLSIIFVVLSIIVIATAVLVSIRSLRAGGGPSKEDTAVPSRIFAPAGPFPNAAERELAKEWAASGKQQARTGH